MKRRSTSFIIKEMQVGTIVRYHSYHTMMTIIKMNYSSGCLERCGELQP